MATVMRETFRGEVLTLVDLLRHRADEMPDVTGYTFLADGEDEEVSLTYGQLDRQARAVAEMIRVANPGGEPVLLVCPSSLDFIAGFFGCLYAGSIAVTAYPPRPNRPMERFAVIARDSGAKVVLTLDGIREQMESPAKEIEGLGHLKWLAIEQIDRNVADQWEPPEIDEESIALLQYTSGSTAEPKGTMVSHRNMLHNSRVICKTFGHTKASVLVGWLPMTHDMGLIGDMLQPLFVGFRAVLMAPEHFLVKPIRWLNAISRYRGTTSGGPNFAYDYCCRMIKPELRADLDLSSWEVAFNGAEFVRPGTIHRFTTEFAPHGFGREAFYPCYGLAESTLMVTGGSKIALPVRRAFDAEALRRNRAIPASADVKNCRVLIGCGCSHLEGQLVIVDPDTRRVLPDGHIGEIWHAGPSVAKGYWKKRDETEQTFHAYVSDTGEGPFLRTGDLGFTSDGELYVSGRLKDLLIIGGVNHYPTDIELTVESAHAAIRENQVAAVSVETAAGEGLVVVAEVDRRFLAGDVPQAAKTLSAAIRESISRHHDLSAQGICLIKQSTLPRTSSGKIQRHVCRNQFLKGELSLV